MFGGSAAADGRIPRATLIACLAGDRHTEKTLNKATLTKIVKGVSQEVI